MRSRPLVPLLAADLVLLAAACGGPAGRERAEAGGAAVACDSAAAARVALDSLARLDHFRSEVYRYQVDSAGARIVTWSASRAIVDGMAIVRVDRACRVTSLVQTDSA